MASRPPAPLPHTIFSQNDRFPMWDGPMLPGLFPSLSDPCSVCGVAIGEHIVGGPGAYHPRSQAMTGKLEFAPELLAMVLFPGLRVKIVGVEFVDDPPFVGRVRLHLTGEDVPHDCERLTAIIHTREIEGDPHQWRWVELVPA